MFPPTFTHHFSVGQYLVWCVTWLLSKFVSVWLKPCGGNPISHLWRVCVWVCEQGTWQTHCLETVGNRATFHLPHNPLSVTPSRRSGNVMREDIRRAVTQIHVDRQLMLSFITISEKKPTMKTGWEFFKIWFHYLFNIGHSTPKQLEDIRFRAHGKIVGMWIMPGRHFEDHSHVRKRRVTWVLL